MFADLKRSHIALAFEIGVLSGKDSSGRQACDVGIEGFAAPDTARGDRQRIKNNGGELRNVAMDEPLVRHYGAWGRCAIWRTTLRQGPRCCARSSLPPRLAPSDWIEELINGRKPIASLLAKL